MAAFDLTRARSAEGETDGVIFMEPMSFVEQLGNFLYFVDDDLPKRLLGFDFRTQQLRVLQIAAVLVRLKQIDPQGVGVCPLEQRGLASLSWPPEKKGLHSRPGQLERSIEHIL